MNMAAIIRRPFSLTYQVYCQIHNVACTNFSTSSVFLAKAKAAAKAKAMAQMTERKRMTVETDPEKLVNYVCGANIHMDGEDPKIKPDSEYPDWLWTLRTERGIPPLEELDENSFQYWRILKRQERARVALLKKTKHKFHIYGRTIVKGGTI